MNDSAFRTLMAASMSALQANIQTWALLAERGLLSPEQIDRMAHSISVPFEALEDDELARMVRSTYDAHLTPVIAEIHRKARETYRPPDNPA